MAACDVFWIERNEAAQGEHRLIIEFLIGLLGDNCDFFLLIEGELAMVMVRPR